MYRDIEGIVKINGALSAPFKVQRGVRQGCLSGMLYSLPIEALLHNVRLNLSDVCFPGSKASDLLIT